MNSQSVDQAWPEPTVIDALRLLSGHCDGARTLDGAGFNRFDSDFGRSLAARDSLSPKQESSALKMLRKYRRQLAIGGIDYDKLADRTNQARHANSDAQDRPKRVVVLSGTRFVFRYPWDPVITAAIGKLPDRRFHDHDHPWHGEYKVWSMPLDRSLEVEDFAQKFGFRVAPDAQAYIDQNRAAAQAEQDRVEALIAASKAEDSDIELKVQGLRPFQKAGVQYALDRRQTFIADEMGLGKTVQALATIEEDDAFPVVVVAPKSVIRTWRREARKWLPHRTWQIADTKSHIKQNVDITLIHYDVVEKRKEALAGKIIGFREVGKGKHKRQKPVREPSWVKAFIGDESHMIKNRNAKRTMAIEEITESLGEEDPIILLLSGTPLVNRPAELITQLTILRRLNDFGGFMRFWKRYCGGSQGGAQNLNELNTELRMHCMVRRLKKDVLKELPPRQWAPVETPISNEAEYRRAEAAFISWLQETGGNWQAALRAETITRMNALRQLAARGKLEAAIQWIRDFLENGNKLVVFAYHQPIQQAILEALGDYNPRVIKAGQSDEVREQNRIDFQEKDEIRVIVVSLMAGGQGIDLFAASNVAFIELAWTPKDMFQAIDRCHRIGQKSESAVMGWELVCSNTIDDDLQEILEAKFEIHEQAMDGKAAADAEEVGEGAVANAVVERMMARS